MKYSRTVLPNGLTVLTVPSSDAESVVVDIFVKTGSRSETGKENGISHFLEHFLFKGTTKYPSALTITELVDAIGGEMNANTGKEHTQYYIKSDGDHLEMIFEILTDMIQQPLLDNVELQKEKGVIVEEINMYKDLPRYEIDNVLEKLMWPKDSLGQPITGTKDTVTKFTRRMFADYMQRHYQTGNIIIGISGKFNQRVVDKLIKKYWAPVKRRTSAGWNKASNRQLEPQFVLVHKATEQAHITLGFRGLYYNDKRNPVASVLSAILGGGMSSRLFNEIRERRGLAYYIGSSSASYQDTGVFHIDGGIRVDKAEEAVAVIIEELKKIKTLPLESRELNKAKAYIKGRTTLALEDNQTRLDWFIEQEAFRNRIQQPSEMFADIDKVTASDILKLANYLFQPEKMNLAIIGPYKNEKLFRKLLKI